MEMTVFFSPENRIFKFVGNDFLLGVYNISFSYLNSSQLNKIAMNLIKKVFEYSWSLALPKFGPQKLLKCEAWPRNARLETTSRMTNYDFWSNHQQTNRVRYDWWDIIVHSVATFIRKWPNKISNKLLKEILMWHFLLTSYNTEYETKFVTSNAGARATTNTDNIMLSVLGTMFNMVKLW